VIPQTLTVFRPVACVEVNREEPGMLRSVRLFRLFPATLFPVHVGPVLRQVRGRDDVEVIAARPRYYPRWCRGLLRVPGLREIATWNLLLILRRTQ
jgi:hypothetical protein